jgi:RimJ/RimL family protein N-acetyltransferase
VLDDGVVPDLRTPVIRPGALRDRPQPTIEANGLTLRPWSPADVPSLVRAYADPDIRRWHVRSMDEDEALAWVLARHEMWRTETGGDWAVTSAGEPVARAALRRLDLRGGCGEAGYWVLPEARGRGVAGAALRALTAWLFEDLGLHRLEVEHSTQNPASCRVASRAGFAAEGTRRRAVLHEDGWHDMHVHARLSYDENRGSAVERRRGLP